MGEFEHLSQTPPEETQQAETTTDETTQGQTTETPESTSEEQTTTTEPQTGATTGGTTTEEPAKVDEFIESFNKRYNTTYKSDDEVKALFGLSGKMAEYEEKLKGHDDLAKSVEAYKTELEELRVNGMSDLLAKPLIKSAYVADQLRVKYPDKDPFMLQEVAMSDLSKMSDLDVIAKEQKIDLPNISLDDLKQAIISEINGETPPEEWTSVDKARLAVRAARAKENIRNLLSGIELPKTVTKEEREALQAKALEDKVNTAKPFKEIFNKFDEYVNEDFKFVVPDEFKTGLSDMFDNMFIKGGLDINQQNLATAELLKKALFMEEYFPQMKAVIEKQAKASIQEKTDEELDNIIPPNTATSTDQTTTEDKLPGVGDFFHSERYR